MAATAGVAATSISIHSLTACFPSINPRSSLFPRENIHWHSAFSSACRIHAVGNPSQGGEDRRKIPRESPSGRWSDQKRLLALFKRIETSISRGKSRNPNEKNAESKSSKDDDNASFQSVLEALQQAEIPKKVRVSNKQASEIEKESTSMPKASSIQINAAESPDVGVDQEPLEMEKMKLTELKEVAKARGIKGYSKMKKSELVDLLITQPKS